MDRWSHPLAFLPPLPILNAKYMLCQVPPSCPPSFLSNSKTFPFPNPHFSNVVSRGRLLFVNFLPFLRTRKLCRRMLFRQFPPEPRSHRHSFPPPLCFPFFSDGFEVERDFGFFSIPYGQGAAMPGPSELELSSLFLMVVHICFETLTFPLLRSVMVGSSPIFRILQDLGRCESPFLNPPLPGFFLPRVLTHPGRTARFPLFFSPLFSRAQRGSRPFQDLHPESQCQSIPSLL